MKRVVLFFVATLVMMGCQPGGRKVPGVDIWAATATDNKVAVEQHIAAGADLNAKEPAGGSTPLILAGVFGRPEIAQILLKYGARTDIYNNSGTNALINAAFFGHPETVRVLLDGGADANATNPITGNTALDAVTSEWTPELENIYRGIGAALQLDIDLDRVKTVRPEIAEILREAGGKKAAQK
jgi:ankyrin repeat protein